MMSNDVDFPFFFFKGSERTVTKANLEAVATEHKFHNGAMLAPLEEGQVLFSLRGHARQGHIIVVVGRGLLALVVHALLGSFATGLCIHEGFVMGAALVVRPVPHDLGQTADQQQLCYLHSVIVDGQMGMS